MQKSAAQPRLFSDVNPSTEPTDSHEFTEEYLQNAFEQVPFDLDSLLEEEGCQDA